MNRSERLVPYLFLLPALLGLLLFEFLPVLYSLGRSLYAVSFGLDGGGLIFVELDNFRSLFTDPVFWNSLRVTLIFNVVLTPLQVILALALALLVNVPVRGVGIFRGLFFIPVGVSLTVTSLIWSLMLDSQSGLLNGILTAVGIPAQGFLIDASQVLASIMLVATWKGLAGWMVFFLAGLQGIPQSLYEAASIDGASRLRIFYAITLPLLRRSLAFVVIATTVANFLLFAPAYILTPTGGPQGASDLLMFEAFQSAYSQNDLGRGTGITDVLLLLLLLIVGLELLLFRWLDR